MKKIKFRQRLKDGIWHYWGFIGQHFVSPVLNSETFEDAIKNSNPYTGVKDQNKKEIYVGDILQVIRVNWYCPGHPDHDTDLVDHREIYFDEERNSISSRTIDLSRKNQPPYSGSGSFGSGPSDERADKNVIKIIGDIYNNPELIEN